MGLGTLRRKLVLQRRLGSFWSDLYVQHGMWPSDDISLTDEGRLQLPAPGPAVHPDDVAGHELLRYGDVLPSLAKLGVRFVSQPGDLTATVDGLEVKLKTPGDFGIFLEIFLHREYCFHRAGEFVVIDAGANIGLASLYFARRYRTHVYSYEFVPTTAKRAAENIALNPDCASLIQLNPVGLGNSDRSLTVSIDTGDTASNSIYGTHGSEKQEVQVRDVAAVISEVAAAHPGKQIVMKLDVEGAEYEVMDRLQETGKLGDISVLMMEWHDQGADSLERVRGQLRDGGFDWFEQPHPTLPVGLIHAIRR